MDKYFNRFFTFPHIMLALGMSHLSAIFRMPDVIDVSDAKSNIN